MADPSIEVPLPIRVETLLQTVCQQKALPLPDVKGRRSLSMIGEAESLALLHKIASVTTEIKLINPYLTKSVENLLLKSTSVSPLKRSFSKFSSGSPPKSPFIAMTPSSKVPTPNITSPLFINSAISGCSSPVLKRCTCSPSSSSNGEIRRNASRRLFDPPTPNKNGFSNQQLTLEDELEFRKLFLLRSYIGRKKLEDVVSEEGAIEIVQMKHTSMVEFESKIWKEFGSKYCLPSDRAVYLDWDSGKTHLYNCHVEADGSYHFKGPYLSTSRTHLQRTIGAENVLIVKFADDINVSDMAENYRWILDAGILIGFRRYRFFAFKDGGKENKNFKEAKKKASNLWTGKCFFIRTESVAPWGEREPYSLLHKTMPKARCLFMHVHTVPNMAKYIARLSLILSQTNKLKVDLASVDIERINDIPCRDENGSEVHDQDGKTRLHTDGTGFISEDLALLCPKDFKNAKYITDGNIKHSFDHGMLEEKALELGEKEASHMEPPLLIQCRLFHEGLAVKGTLLLNKKLKNRTIQIRDSMIKVERDPNLSNTESFSSLEIVAVSHKPKSASLSRNLIALLSIGGVPKEYFLELLESALQDAQSSCRSTRAALRVARNHGDMDDYSISERMIMAGISLDESCLQYRLLQLANEERKGLGAGKLPIKESFYLMGTADPTGVLKSNQVCVILDTGPISGKVLVYRNPGIHFGDVHILDAVYVRELEDFIGNAKYAIFFSTKGRRSVGEEIANGDFDGDMYWVSRNPQLLSYFKVSGPWTRIYSAGPTSASSTKPSDFSDERLEHELFNLLFAMRKQSSVAGMAAETWLAFMDRFLILRDDDNADDKHLVKEKMLQLVDLYYDALDAAKSGKKVVFPESLKVYRYPHYMEKSPEYHSISILGLIYDRVQAFINDDKLPKEEIRKLPQFNVEVPYACLVLWRDRYNTYRNEMMNSLQSDNERKRDSANSVIRKYKQMLYDAADLEESARKIEDIYNDALAIYHAVYDHAISVRDVKKCRFAWRVAGSALCHFHIMKLEAEKSEKSIRCLPSVLKELY